MQNVIKQYEFEKNIMDKYKLFKVLIVVDAERCVAINDWIDRAREYMQKIAIIEISKKSNATKTTSAVIQSYLSDDVGFVVYLNVCKPDMEINICSVLIMFEPNLLFLKRQYDYVVLDKINFLHCKKKDLISCYSVLCCTYFSIMECVFNNCIFHQKGIDSEKLCKLELLLNNLCSIPTALINSKFGYSKLEAIINSIIELNIFTELFNTIPFDLSLAISNNAKSVGLEKSLSAVVGAKLSFCIMDYLLNIDQSFSLNGYSALKRFYVVNHNRYNDINYCINLDFDVEKLRKKICIIDICREQLVDMYKIFLAKYNAIIKKIYSINYAKINEIFNYIDGSNLIKCVYSLPEISNNKLALFVRDLGLLNCI